MWRDAYVILTGIYLMVKPPGIEPGLSALQADAMTTLAQVPTTYTISRYYTSVYVFPKLQEYIPELGNVSSHGFIKGIN